MWSELIDGDRLSREKIDAVAAGTDRYLAEESKPRRYFSASTRLSTRSFVLGLLCPVPPLPDCPENNRTPCLYALR